MQKWAVCCLFLCCTFAANAQFRFFNNGAAVSIKPGAEFIIKSSSNSAELRNSGYFVNESDIIIEGSFLNMANDTATGVDTASISLSRDWTNDGVFIAGQSTVFLTGANQVIKGASPTPFYNLTLSGTGIKSMQQDASVSGILSLNDLELATDTQTLTVLNSDSAAITRTTGFVSGLHNGSLERLITSDSFSYFYPLGSSAGNPRYRPLIINATDTLPVIIGARLGNVDATLEGYDRNNRSSDICGINPNFYHQISRTLGNSPVDITMLYNPVEDGLWSQISHWQNVPRWELAGLSIPMADSVFNTLTLRTWNDFSPTPFALMVPATLIDTTETLITHVRCNGGNEGAICVTYPPIAGTEPYEYTWLRDSTVLLSGPDANCISSLTAGIYTLALEDSFGCPNIYTFEITQPAPIEAEVDTFDVSCNGGSDGGVCITAVTGQNPPFMYSWLVSTSDSNCIGGLFRGVYSGTITDGIGCTTTVFAAVNEPDALVAIAEGIDVTCYGFNDGQAFVTVAGGTEPYLYAWSNADSIESTTGLPAETVSVTVTDNNGCTAVSSTDILQPDSLVVTAGNDTTTFTNFSVTLYVRNVAGGNGTETYEWSPSANVASPQSPTSSVTPSETTDFIVTVTDINGCTASDTLRVQVDENLYTFPDGFVPNGNNNIFMPVISSTVTVLKLEIFNRWGQLVGSDPTGWDGKYKGELQPMDTYVYQSVLQLPDGSQKTERGDFILIW